MTLVELILKYREAHDISQRQFAAACGLSNGYISMIEKNLNPKTGLPVKPSIPALKKIATGMNMSLNELLLRVDDMAVDLAPNEWSGRFKETLAQIIATKNSTDLADSEINMAEIAGVLDGTILLTFDCACSIADELGESLDTMLGRNALEIAKSALGEESGLDIEIINLILSLPENKKVEATNYLHYLLENAKI